VLFSDFTLPIFYLSVLNNNVMQTDKSKKSKYLFEVELEEDEVDALVHLDPDILRKLFYRCGKTFQK